MAETYLYKRAEWPPHVRTFYAEWLKSAGLRADSAYSFDRFVSLMEERIGEFLTASYLDHSSIGLIPTAEGNDE